jgi:hypothetical protein
MKLKRTILKVGDEVRFFHFFSGIVKAVERQEDSIAVWVGPGDSARCEKFFEEWEVRLVDESLEFKRAKKARLLKQYGWTKTRGDE